MMCGNPQIRRGKYEFGEPAMHRLLQNQIASVCCNLSGEDCQSVLNYALVLLRDTAPPREAREPLRLTVVGRVSANVQPSNVDKGLPGGSVRTAP